MVPGGGVGEGTFVKYERIAWQWLKKGENYSYLVFIVKNGQKTSFYVKNEVILRALDSTCFPSLCITSGILELEKGLFV